MFVEHGKAGGRSSQARPQQMNTASGLNESQRLPVREDDCARRRGASGTLQRVQAPAEVGTHRRSDRLRGTPHPACQKAGTPEQGCCCCCSLEARADVSEGVAEHSAAVEINAHPCTEALSHV